MPLRIIRQDITKINCDAIVNPTNFSFAANGGVDGAIHKAAGAELIEYCRGLGGCHVGEARLTPAFKLPCKYVIHTVGPVWQGGKEGEEAQLRSCYRECMALALERGCESIAFPLISSGLHGFPKDKVLRIAVEVLSEYLTENEIDVSLVVYDKSSYSISKRLYFDVQSFLDENFEGAEYRRRIPDGVCASAAPPKRRAIERSSYGLERFSEAKSESLEDMLKKMDKGFADTLFYYIDKAGISDVEAYKRSNVDKKTFSKIKCNKDHRPSKTTAVSFAIGLRLSLKEAEHLLRTAGICLSRSNKFDVIIEYFLTTGDYGTIHDVNQVLYQFDQSLLGV